MMARGGPWWSVALLQRGLRPSASRGRLSQHAGRPSAAPALADLPRPRHLRSVSHEPMQFSTKASVDVGMGIGIAVARNDGEASHEPLGNANHVLYLRRGEGRGSFVSFCAGQRTKKSDLGRLPPACNLMQKLDKRQAMHETRLRMLARFAARQIISMREVSLA